MIDKTLLEHFGFKPIKKKMGVFEIGSYYTEALELYYNSDMHSDKQFASNVVAAVEHITKRKIQSVINSAIRDYTIDSAIDKL